MISFHGECCNFETRYYRYTDSQGRIESGLSLDRVNTYTETYNVPYYSARDVSGLFYLNCDKDILKRSIISN